MRFWSVFKKFVHPNKHIQPLLPSNIIPSRNPNPEHNLAHGATPIPAPAPRAAAPAGNDGYSMARSGEAPSDIKLIMNSETTVDSFQQKLENLQQMARILLIVSIILTVLTCGIQIPALWVTCAALLKLNQCAHLNRGMQTVCGVEQNELMWHNQNEDLNKVRQKLKWTRNWLLSSVAILMMLLLFLFSLYIIFANFIRS